MKGNEVKNQLKMEIYVHFLISIIFCACIFYQTTDILLDLYYTHTNENKNECKLIKNKLKTTKTSQNHALKLSQETFNWFMYHGVY